MNWEYKSVHISDGKDAEIESVLNALGSEGWEMITLELEHGLFAWAVFKREKKEA